MHGRNSIAFVGYGSCSLRIGVMLLLLAGTISNATDPPHPMLYFNFDSVANLRIKAATSHKHIADKITHAVQQMKNNRATYLPPESISDFKGSMNEIYGDNLCVLATYCLLFPKDHEALQMAHTYMDALAGYQSWEVAAVPHNEMPISHTLVGLATAYDFLYNTLGVEQRKAIFMRIRLSTQRYFERFKISGWGRHHVQTDTFVNGVALLIGALVVNSHDQRASQWVKLATSHLNVSMTLLSLIVDGSLSQGASYSTYTSLPIMTFAFLASRHLGLSYYGHAWLMEYFWFLYGTLLPGYRENVGIADSSAVWSYGPEAHLVFLDSYVMKTGFANWLASEISRARVNQGILKPTYFQQWSTYHLEFIWYNDEIMPQVPNIDSSLLLFSDWGVATYGGGAPAGHTFLSFKSGVLMGHALHTVISKGLYKSAVDGWGSFSPQHDHPDQLSFTFWPRGDPFITDGYYGPKMTVLNNALLFGPSSEAKCSAPYEGQLGECYQWFNWNAAGVENSTAHLVATYEELDTVFVSGEAASSYPSHLGLSSVYRSAFLLTSDVLLVVDHVTLHPNSKIAFLSAIFNMRAGLLKLKGKVAELLNKGKYYYVHWTVDKPTKLLRSGGNIMIGGFEYPCERETRETQYVNITIPMVTDMPTRVAYLFYRQGPKVTPPLFSASEKHGVDVTMTIDDIKYNVSIATEHNNPSARFKFLGFPGYGSVATTSGKWIWYGFENYEPAYLVVHHEVITNFFNLLFFIVSLATAVLVVLSKSSYAEVVNYWVSIYLHLTITIVASLFSVLLITFIFLQPQVIQSHVTYTKYSLPNVFISSLKFSGAEVISGMFDRSPDFLHVQIPSIAVQYPDVEHVFGHFIDPCVWNEQDMDKNTMMAGWLSSFFRNPLSHLKRNLESDKDGIMSELLRVAHERPNARLVMTTQDGTWNLKLPWAAKSIGSSARIIYIIRDPRAWVAALLKSEEYKNVVEDLKYTYKHSSCIDSDRNAALYATVWRELNAITTGESRREDHIKLLAYLWYVDTASSLINNANMSLESYLVMRLEDLILEPENTIKTLFQFVSMPIPPLAQHYVLQVTRSNQFKLSTGERIGQQSMEWWQEYISSDQIRTIEEICKPVMDMVGYELVQYNG